MARPKKLDVHRDQLIDLYVTHNLSQVEIAQRLGVSQATVTNYLKESGVPARPAMRRPKVTVSADAIRRLYCDEKLTMDEVAAKLGCSYATARKAVIAIGVVPFNKGYRRPKGRAAFRAKFALKTETSGYTYESVPGHPSAKKRGHYVGCHRLVVERVIGRYLTPMEHVHHIDINRANNEMRNLAVLNSSDHARVHKHMCHVAAYLCGLTSIRPEPLDFGEPVFWGGQHITRLDLIGEAESAGRLRVLKPAGSQPAATVN